MKILKGEVEAEAKGKGSPERAPQERSEQIRALYFPLIAVVGLFQGIQNNGQFQPRGFPEEPEL